VRWKCTLDANPSAACETVVPEELPGERRRAVGVVTVDAQRV
jgi:hypothetical protein